MTRFRATALALFLIGLSSHASAEKRFVIAEVEAATRVAVEACIDALTSGQPLLGLERHGFVKKSRGYRAKVDNPLIFAGDSIVRVAIERNGDCTVETEPVINYEIPTIKAILSEAMQARGSSRDARLLFSNSGPKTRIVLR